MPLLDHAGSFTLSLGHSTRTIPPGSGPWPPWRGSSTHHMPIRRCLYRRTDGRIAGQRPRDRPGWGSHGDGCRSRWRPYVNNPRPVADPASAKGDPIPRPASCQSAPSQTRGSTCMSRRVARRRRTWPRAYAAAAGINCAPRPALARKQIPSREYKPPSFKSGFLDEAEVQRVVHSVQRCRIVKHIRVRCLK
jgi:hypothetical protein